MTNLDRAYELNNGIVITEDGAYLTSGSSSPVGLDLPVRTIYLQESASGILIWKKFGTGVNDWRQLSAQDIPFLPSLAENETATDLQQLGEDLANRHYGKDFSHQFTNNLLTTSNNELSYDTLNFSVTAENTPNKYRTAINLYWNASKDNESFIGRLYFDGTLEKEIEISPSSRDASTREANTLLYYPTNLSTGNHTLELRFLSTKGNTTARVYQADFEVWRVE